uniref:Uncharacterized protein n=1 Tax=Physcomitrium patens TaxID=3218 RepID=A0A7I4F157_PHYPA
MRLTNPNYVAAERQHSPSQRVKKVEDAITGSTYSLARGSAEPL